MALYVKKYRCMVAGGLLTLFLVFMGGPAESEVYRGDGPGRPADVTLDTEERCAEAQRKIDCVGSYGTVDQYGDCDGAPIGPCC
jgi:hypothetical protein